MPTILGSTPGVVHLFFEVNMIENHVVNLELSKRLKEFGYPQKSIFYWAFLPGKNGNITIPKKDEFELFFYEEAALFDYSRYQLQIGKSHIEQYNLTYYASPTATELFENLPSRIKNKNPDEDDYLLKIRKLTGKTEYQVYYDALKSLFLFSIEEKLITNALAKMWIYLKENELLKA